MLIHLHAPSSRRGPSRLERAAGRLRDHWQDYWTGRRMRFLRTSDAPRAAGDDMNAHCIPDGEVARA